MFILEGIPAIFCGIYTFFFLPDFPDESRFLDPDERQILIDHLPKSQPRSSAKTWNTQQVKALFKDPTLISFTLIWVFHAIGGWGVSTVLPTVIYQLGLTDTAFAQLQVPQGYRIEAAIAIGRRGDKSRLPEAMQSREEPNGRLPIEQLIMEGHFRSDT